MTVYDVYLGTVSEVLRVLEGNTVRRKHVMKIYHIYHEVRCSGQWVDITCSWIHFLHRHDN